MEYISEAQAVSEVFKLFSALFDGPPPLPAAVRVIDDILPALRKTLDLGERETDLRPECFAAEYENLFLVPSVQRQLDPYSTSYAKEPEEARAKLIPELLMLAEILRIPWQKENFIAGRAYPVMPDHLSVLFGLLSVTSLVDIDADIAGKSALEWNSTLAEEAALTLGEMRNVMLARVGSIRNPGYCELITVALAYVRTYLEVGLSCHSSRSQHLGGGSHHDERTA